MACQQHKFLQQLCNIQVTFWSYSVETTSAAYGEKKFYVLPKDFARIVMFSLVVFLFKHATFFSVSSILNFFKTQGRVCVLCFWLCASGEFHVTSLSRCYRLSNILLFLLLGCVFRGRQFLCSTQKKWGKTFLQRRGIKQKSIIFIKSIMISWICNFHFVKLVTFFTLQRPSSFFDMNFDQDFYFYILLF